MKTLIIALISLFTIAAVTVPSQANAQVLRTITPTKDSVVNTDSTIVFSGLVDNNTVSFTVTGTRASGTIASTNVTLWGSVDGTNWSYISSSALFNAATTFATVTLDRQNKYFARYMIKVVSGCTCEIDPITVIQLRR
jgi:hypothetical protein